jgi:hypothetical protein
MVAVYIIILCFSTLFAAWVMSRASQRFAGLISREAALIPVGVFAAVTVIAFMVVVAVPATVLVGALLLLAVSHAHARLYWPPVTYWGGLAIAVLLGLSGLHFPSIPHLPMAVLMGVAMIGWYAIAASGDHAPNDLPGGTLGFIAACVPLAAAPLFFAPSSIALDSALILCALLGTLVAGRATDTLGGARMPLAYLLGWLMIEAALRGAWPCAVISILAWAAAIAYATLHRENRDAFFTTP